MPIRFNSTTPLVSLSTLITMAPLLKSHLPALSLARLKKYGPISGLRGKWVGPGFNQIWRPNNTPGQDRFLELNLTTETLEFKDIQGDIPNRGMFQPDINLHGISYVQNVSDTNVLTGGKPSGIHFEPGIWLNVPPTTDPANPTTVARMGSIPHGTTLLAQGTGHTAPGGPSIPPVSITPFIIGNPGGLIQFPEVDLGVPTPFRSPPPNIVGITQAMVDDPNVVLQAGLVGKTILATTTLQIDTVPPGPPSTGGGTDNIAFLEGDPAPARANARCSRVQATFWLESYKDIQGKLHHQLQYTQLVLLDFNGLSWPHVSVATLQKV